MNLFTAEIIMRLEVKKLNFFEQYVYLISSDMIRLEKTKTT